ncbi:uncharacterized protein BJ212DRAFT_1351250 [Suillus subaureus]|uniref:Uncharacterized protein n=1 Tax=Suillus subaureus TaxID=48587 RepID=A0A9P7JDQ9_9AGAM|nr:uncharacterized protein BJ212DRAFT_1351250 [Suillus subaureus]KAG1817147.1 hypothetical protein BJ212DRAFT_1351250 [Suillus subaureus]
MFDQYTSPIMLHTPHMFDPYKEKVNPGHLYVRQPHDAIQIIQLVEASPPPRRDIESSSYGFSSGSSYPSTSDSEDEEDCSSYCSSFVTPPHPSQDREPVAWTDDTYDVRMKRVQNWRDNSIKVMSASAEPRSSSLKRKLNQNQIDDDLVSHTPKRSRSRDPHNASRLFGHSCTACDTPFSSRQGLRQHGRTPYISDACRIAVEYNFE